MDLSHRSSRRRARLRHLIQLNQSANTESRSVDDGRAPRYAQIAPFFVDHEGYPAIAPPWGTLNAIDLNKGEILWKVPLGEYPELVERGIRHTGTRSFGGPILTAGDRFPGLKARAVRFRP